MLPNGICANAEQALKMERNIQASLKRNRSPLGNDDFEKELRKKYRLITELYHRIETWESLECRQCKASLRGVGPSVPNEQEVALYEQGEVDRVPDRFKPATHVKAFEDADSSRAVILLQILRKIPWIRLIRL